MVTLKQQTLGELQTLATKLELMDCAQLGNEKNQKLCWHKDDKKHYKKVAKRAKWLLKNWFMDTNEWNWFVRESDKGEEK